MNKQVERDILKIFNSVYKKVFNKKNTDELAKGNQQPIIESIAKFQTSEKYNKFATIFAKELAKKGLNKQKGVWKKFYEAAKKQHIVGLPYTYSEYEEKMMRDVVSHNFTMIKSIPQEMSDILQYKLVGNLINEVAQGKLSRGAFKRELDKHGVKKSKLIARTETSKLQSAITEHRATNLGSVAYEWIASRDRRTRESHKEMDGVIVFWRPDAQKPLRDNMRGNAGEFPNCRCYPSAILRIEELEDSNYKVYNYHNDKIEKGWSRKKLIDAIQRGYI